MDEDGKKCCASKKSKHGQVIDTGLSKILLGVLSKDKKEKLMTRHEARFGITSFIYRARRPFHPGRLHAWFLDLFFIYQGSGMKEATSKETFERQEKRKKCMGGLMRSKGFVKNNFVFQSASPFEFVTKIQVFCGLQLPSSLPGRGSRRATSSGSSPTGPGSVN